MTRYVADRCGLPAGTLTRAEAIDHLARREVAPEVIEQVDHLLERCESMRYAANGQDAVDDLPTAASRCVSRLERERF
jgi:hypothetical protein